MHFEEQGSLCHDLVYFALGRDFPKHWEECAIGKRTPKRNKTSDRRVKEGSGDRGQLNSSLPLSTWDCLPEPWGPRGFQVLQQGSVCTFPYQRSKLTAEVPSERRSKLRASKARSHCKPQPAKTSFSSSSVTNHLLSTPIKQPTPLLSEIYSGIFNTEPEHS